MRSSALWIIGLRSAWRPRGRLSYALRYWAVYQQIRLTVGLSSVIRQAPS